MNHTDKLISDYLDRHPRSAALHREAKGIFPADGATHFARVLNPYRPYITHADGSKKWDVDGNEYIDYVMGHGALILGHNHGDVVRAVQEQVARGVHYGDNHDLEITWAKLIMEMFPSAENMVFFACGNEANMMAIRLSRVFTGRKKILRFEKHYHGWADELTAATEPAACRANVTIIAHNDLNRLEKELSTKEYAVLFTEAGGAFIGGQTPLDIDFTRQISALTKKYGTLWLLDEVVTGLRVAPGGWQSVIGVQPDLTSLGKCIGGGLSVGALIGRADVLEALHPETAPARRVGQGGTWNANPLTAAAGIAACKLLKTGEPQQQAAEAAALFRREGNKILREKMISASFYGPSSIIYFYHGLMDHKPLDETLPPVSDHARITDPAMRPFYNRLLLNLLQRGVSNILGTIFIFSAMHTEEDVGKTLVALQESLEAMRLAEGGPPILIDPDDA